MISHSADRGLLCPRFLYIKQSIPVTFKQHYRNSTNIGVSSPCQKVTFFDAICIIMAGMIHANMLHFCKSLQQVKESDSRNSKLWCKNQASYDACYHLKCCNHLPFNLYNTVDPEN